MRTERFSRRYGQLSRPDRLLYGDATPRVRERLPEIIERDARVYAGGAGHEQLFDAWCAALDVPVDLRSGLSLENIAQSCAWDQLYDLCELTFRFLYRERRGRFIVGINALLAEEGIGYRMTSQGLLQRVVAPSTEQAVSEAQRVLEAPELSGPAEQFGKALALLSRRPRADFENCIKDAAGAVEGVARILTGKRNRSLAQITAWLASTGQIHGALAKLFDGLWGYRSAEQGVGHSMEVGSQATAAEAELALAVSAALIVYLVAKLRNGSMGPQAK